MTRITIKSLQTENKIYKMQLARQQRRAREVRTALVEQAASDDRKSQSEIESLRTALKETRRQRDAANRLSSDLREISAGLKERLDKMRTLRTVAVGKFRLANIKAHSLLSLNGELEDKAAQLRTEIGTRAKSASNVLECFGVLQDKYDALIESQNETRTTHICDNLPVCKYCENDPDVVDCSSCGRGDS